MGRPKKVLSPEDLAAKQEAAASKEATKIKKQCLERVLRKKTFNWPMELKIINQLVEKYPNLEFWRTFDTNFSFALPSFAWFLGKGQDYLAQEYRRQTTDLSALIKKNDAPEVNSPQIPHHMIEKVEITKKPKTLKDFLK